MGVNDETFRLMLDGQECPIASNYTVRAGVFDVPHAFTMRIGHSGFVKPLLETYPEFTPFELYVGDVRTQRGELDKFQLVGAEGTEVELSGRDLLKWLVDYPVPEDRTFAEKTFLQLVEVAFREVGLEGKVVALNNVANRKAITGSDEIEVPITTEETQTEAGAVNFETKRVYKTIRAEIGTSWWDFLKTQFRRAGLFLWSTADGNFVLSRPDGGQKPIYRILRRRGATAGDVTVLGQPKFFRDASKRYTECIVCGRAGGGKDGRGRITGSYVDDEMVAILNPEEADRVNGGKRKKPLIVTDKHVRTVEQAKFLARRRIAESRRAGFHLEYTVSGHLAPALSGGGMNVWQPDTVAHLIDEELGIDSLMYIATVAYTRLPETKTALTLMRPDDLIFAEEDFDRVPKTIKPAVRMGKTEKFVWVRDPRMGNLPTGRWQDEKGNLRDAKSTDVVWVERYSR